jgi:hypothetical protein
LPLQLGSFSTLGTIWGRGNMGPIDLFSWKIVQWVLWVGPFGVAGFLSAVVAVSAYVGYLFGRRK